MKKFLFTVLAVLLFPLSVSAHAANQPPFVYVNDQPVGLYPVGYSSLPDLKLPEDIAPESYLVNTPITFAIKLDTLPIFPEELAFLTFEWTFQDTIKATGLEVTHTYTEIGSKNILLHTTDSRTPEAPAQLLETLYLNVFPNSDYKLPQPIIEVNGLRSKDLVSDILKIDFNKKVVLDGTKSIAGSSPIETFTWDLGNRAMSMDSKSSINYDPIFSNVIPVLRITDQNGFFADATVQIENSTLSGPLTAANSNSTTQRPPTWVYYLLGILGLSTLVAMFWRRSTGNSDYHSRNKRR